MRVWPRAGRLDVFFAIAMLAPAACAPRTDDVTPAIAVSPGAKGRLIVMDRYRHHGDVRRWLPRVTVEEVDDDAGLEDQEEEVEASDASDAGAP